MNPSDLPHSDVTGTISHLFVYPVKSCAGIEVQAARLTELELRAPEMPVLAVQFEAVGPLVTVQVWDDHVPAHDMGDQVAAWFSQFLSNGANSTGYRLVRFDTAHRRVSSLKWTDGVQALNQFCDGFPLLVISEASLTGLNQRLQAAGHDAVSMARFRPNVVLAGVDAHDEDRVAQIHLDAEPSSVLLKPVKPCARCPIPNIDPATSISSPEVADTLQGYRQDARLNGAVTFGMNCIMVEGVGSVLRVGQAITAELDFG